MARCRNQVNLLIYEKHAHYAAQMLKKLTVFPGRHLDHQTTRTRTRRSKQVVYQRNDPNITVYIGNTPGLNKHNFEGQGHLYLVYGKNCLPSRLARSSELTYASHGINPEIFDRTGRHLLPVVEP